MFIRVGDTLIEYVHVFFLFQKQEGIDDDDNHGQLDKTMDKKEADNMSVNTPHKKYQVCNFFKTGFCMEIRNFHEMNM